MHVLALNSGSSSLKFGLYRVTDGIADVLLDGEESVADEPETHDAVASPGLSHALDRIAELLARGDLPRPDAVGHRIVHGGSAVRRDRVIDAQVLEQLDAARTFAPLHVPSAMVVVRFAMRRFPDVPQVACLDTAFHADLDDVARRFPLPQSITDPGLHRYGFHGLSCQSIVRHFGDDVPARLVIAHLGNGASITAVRDGRSIDTSMGLTPTGGVMMGTRSGDLDPGILFHLMRERHLDVDQIEDFVNHHAGLLGVSGCDSDMRELRSVAAANADADLAIRMFCSEVRKQIAAMGTVLGGIDVLVFAGGIGEHDAATRHDICAPLGWMGVALDASRNDLGTGRVSSDRSIVEVRVCRSNEDEQMALNVVDVITCTQR
jgi:acetate kinase